MPPPIMSMRNSWFEGLEGIGEIAIFFKDEIRSLST